MEFEPFHKHSAIALRLTWLHEIERRLRARLDPALWASRRRTKAWHAGTDQTRDAIRQIRVLRLALAGLGE